MLQKLRGKNGFTLIEVMIVIAIIGILASIFIPNFLEYREKTYAGVAKENLREAYNAAQVYFENTAAKFDDYQVTLIDLEENGFILRDGVTLKIIVGKKMGLRISAKHENSRDTFVIYGEGTIVVNNKIVVE
ncbi:type IV pilin protein [Patescibacteria group bacterium]